MTINFTEQEWENHLKKNTVLIIDDEEYKRQRAAGIALANGFFFECAKSADEGWEKIYNQRNDLTPKYSLVIVDNSMQNSKSDIRFDYSTLNGLDAELLGSRHLENNQGLQLVRRIRNYPFLENIDFVRKTKDFPSLANLEFVMYSGSDVEKQAEALEIKFIGEKLYLLNDILRSKSELYK